MPYTPSTEEVYRAHWRGTPMRSEDGLREHVALDRLLAEVIRKAKADGFDEGWDARVNAETITPTENPYRQGETE